MQIILIFVSEFYDQLLGFCEDYGQDGIFRLWLYEGSPLIALLNPEYCEVFKHTIVFNL